MLLAAILTSDMFFEKIQVFFLLSVDGKQLFHTRNVINENGN